MIFFYLDIDGIVHYYFFPKMAACFNEIKMDGICLIAILIGSGIKEYAPGNCVRTIYYFSIGGSWSANMKRTDGFHLTKFFQSGDQLFQVLCTFGVIEPEVHVMNERFFSIHNS